MNNWNKGVLGDFITLQRGFDLPEYERHTGNVPVVTSSGISDFHNEAKVKAPGVVMGRYGTIGAIYFVEEDYWPHNTTLWIKDFKGNYQRFIYYFLKTLDYQAHNDKSSVPGVNRNHLHLIPVNIPPLPEQRAIAGILGALDDKIELNRRMNRTLESMTRAVFRQWFVENAEVGDWEEKPLPEAIDFLEGPGIRNWQYTNTDEGIRFINIRCIQDRDITVETANRIYEDDVNKKYMHFLLHKDDVVVSTSGTLGRFAIVRDEHLPLLLNTSVIRMRPVEGVLTWSYLIGYIESEEFQFELESRASGSVQKNFGPMHLRQIIMRIPPFSILEKFEQITEPLHRKILQNFTESRTLASLRDSLLPKLMRGEVRVSEL